MVLWIGFAVMTAAVIMFITRPLLGGDVRAAKTREADLAVYRDQMAEIEADRARGLIEAAEADSARAELGRRILATGARHEDDLKPEVAGARTPLWVSTAAAAFISVASVTVYISLGAPGLPDQPHSARLTAPSQNATVAELIGRVEAELRTNPEDGRGWDVLAPVYLRLNRFSEAADAYGNAIRLLGESANRLAGFAEASILGNDGIVTEPARKAYARLLETQPDFAEARFWLAVAQEQDGNREAAAEAYRSLLATAPEDAHWRQIVVDRLAAVTGEEKPGAVKPGAGAGADAEGNAASPDAQVDTSGGQKQSGPTAQDIASAQAMTPAEREQFINQMVAQLAQRLEQQPDDMAGWVRLVRAYSVLGRKDDALAALNRAKQTFPDDSDKHATLDGLAVELGLGS